MGMAIFDRLPAQTQLAILYKVRDQMRLEERVKSVVDRTVSDLMSGRPPSYSPKSQASRTPMDRDSAEIRANFRRRCGMI